jgi:hypothetical protein
LKLNATALCLLLSVFAACTARAQETPAAAATPTPAAMPIATPTPAATTAVTARPVLKTIKLTVQYGGKVPVVRKHFYLSRLPFNTDELQQKLGNMPSHKDYLKKASGPALSEELLGEFVREWLERYRCETIYCQPIALEDVQRIRVFQDAYKRAGELFPKAADAERTALALKWMPNFLPQEIRTGYFDMKTDWVKRALALMEAQSVGGERNLIRTTMTDRRGEAYITDIKPGATYYISNLIPIEDGKDCFLWTYKKEIKEGAAGLEIGIPLGPNAKAKEVKGANSSALTFTCAPPK